MRCTTARRSEATPDLAALVLCSTLLLAADAVASDDVERSAGASIESDVPHDPFASFDDLDGAPLGESMPVFVDRVIASERLEPLPADEDEVAATAGTPRAFHVEAITHRTEFAGRRDVEFGTALGGFQSTADWGDLTWDALLFSGERFDGGDRRLRGTASLWQRGLAMPGGWRVDNGLGVMNTPTPDLLREQHRFILPAVPMLGATTDWRQHHRGLIMQAAAGRGGDFSGNRFVGFDSGGGAVFTAAAQGEWSPTRSGALQALVTDGRIVPDGQGAPSLQPDHVRALFGGHRWKSGHHNVQLNVLASNRDGTTARGAWIDARSNVGDFGHRFGLFRLEPDLAWGAFPIINDVQGAYYRIDAGRGRVRWSASVDRIDSISGTTFDGWFGSAYLRYQQSAWLGYGGTVTARRSGSGPDGSRAESVQTFVDARSDIGQTRVQYDLARDRGAGDSWQLQVDHALRLRTSVRLSVAASIGELSFGTGRPVRTSTVAAFGGFDVTDSFSIDGNLRHTRGEGDEKSRGTDLNLAWRWQLTQRWTLLGNLIESRGERRSPFVLDPLANQVAFVTLPDDRSVFLSLRYEFSAGSALGVLGGPPNSPTGRVEGTVFLDDNGDGVRGAAEAVAADVTVLLDGRFVARTDAAGRFRFDRVAVGTRTIEVVPDNLPLPWLVPEDSLRRSVEVELRAGTVVEIGAVRPR